MPVDEGRYTPKERQRILAARWRVGYPDRTGMGDTSGEGAWIVTEHPIIRRFRVEVGSLRPRVRNGWHMERGIVVWGGGEYPTGTDLQFAEAIVEIHNENLPPKPQPAPLPRGFSYSALSPEERLARSARHRAVPKFIGPYEVPKFTMVRIHAGILSDRPVDGQVVRRSPQGTYTIRVGEKRRWKGTWTAMARETFDVVVTPA